MRYICHSNDFIIAHSPRTFKTKALFGNQASWMSSRFLCRCPPEDIPFHAIVHSPLMLRSSDGARLGIERYILRHLRSDNSSRFGRKVVYHSPKLEWETWILRKKHLSPWGVLKVHRTVPLIGEDLSLWQCGNRPKDSIPSKESTPNAILRLSIWRFQLKKNSRSIRNYPPKKTISTWTSPVRIP